MNMAFGVFGERIFVVATRLATRSDKITSYYDLWRKSEILKTIPIPILVPILVPTLFPEKIK
jgi:hypothetical protein